MVGSQIISQDSKPQEKVIAKKEENTEKEHPATVQESASSTNSQTSTLYQNPLNGERSFIMLKPDAVQRGLMGQIIARFERKGFKLIAMKFVQATPGLLKKHYSDLSKKPFFPELIR